MYSISRVEYIPKYIACSSRWRIIFESRDAMYHSYAFSLHYAKLVRKICHRKTKWWSRRKYSIIAWPGEINARWSSIDFPTPIDICHCGASTVSVFGRYSISRIIWTSQYLDTRNLIGPIALPHIARDIVSTMRKAMPLEENYSEHRERYRGDDGISVGRNSCSSRGISGLKKSGSQHTARRGGVIRAFRQIDGSRFQAVNGSWK